jgi:hypothetical protein
MTVDMLTSIGFENESLFERNEVNDPWAERDLSSEFDTVELARAKKLPKLLFSICQ